MHLSANLCILARIRWYTRYSHADLLPPPPPDEILLALRKAQRGLHDKVCPAFCFDAHALCVLCVVC
jgi:hypothetical protein